MITLRKIGLVVLLIAALMPVAQAQVRQRNGTNILRQNDNHSISVLLPGTRLPISTELPDIDDVIPEPGVVVTTPAPLIRRDVPPPRARPEFREVPAPLARPLMALGRAAIVNAKYERQSIVVLVSTERAGQTIRGLMAEHALGYVEATVLDLLGASLVRFTLPPGLPVREMTNMLAADPRVLSVQPNYNFEIAEEQTPAQPQNMRGFQYAPARLHLAEAHLFTLGRNVLVGVVDTAIDAGHPELANVVVREIDVLGGTVVSRDHGTSMSGLIVAGSALDGVAPAVNLLSVRAFDVGEDGGVTSTSFDLAKAIDQLATAGAQVLNLSFAGPRDPLVLKLMDRLEELDIPIVAAAGNEGPLADPVYPAAHRHAIAVTATDDHDRSFVSANLGMYIELSAPGVDILSPLPDGRYDLGSGTSAATAHVTGVVALMLAVNPGMSVVELRRALASSSLDLGAPGRDEVFGEGLVNAGLAVAAAEQFRP